MQDCIGLAHVNVQSGLIFQQPAAESGVDLHGIEREMLVRTVRLYLERAGIGRNTQDLAEYFFHIRFYLCSDTERVHAEHLAKAIRDLVRSAFVKIFNDVSSARPPYFVPYSAQSLFEIVHKNLFEIATVFPF